MKKAIDVNDLEAQFMNKNRNISGSTSTANSKKGPAFVIGGEEEENEKIVELELSEDEEVIEFDDMITISEPIVKMPIQSKPIIRQGNPMSYASASINVNKINNNNNKNDLNSTQNTNSISYSSSSPSKTMTVEELEAQLTSGLVIGPKSPVSQLVGAGPPPGLSNGGSISNGSNSSFNNNNYINITNNDYNNNNNNTNIPPGITSISSLSLGLPSSITSRNINNIMSSTAPFPKNDPNREFMNRFERNLIMKIHTTQLTTETPLMDDFYYQALTKKKATASEGSGQLLYFPLPSVADRQKEFQRREKRRKQREREREKEDLKDKEKENSSFTDALESNNSINVELVLGKVSHSSYRKPRQQLQVPCNTEPKPKEGTSVSGGMISLHEQVMKGIEAVYSAILSVEDFYLRQEEIERSNGPIKNENNNNKEKEKEKEKSEEQELKDLIVKANEVFYNELRLFDNDKENNFKDNDKITTSASNTSVSTTTSTTTTITTNHVFIHFLTIPKGRASLFRVLKLLDERGKLRFLEILVEHFDFLEVVRPETSCEVIDSFIGQVLSPLVSFVGEADWMPVLSGLKGLFGKRSFVWIALTKAGMVLLCILLSRLEILKATASESAKLIELNGDSVLLDEAAALTEKMFDALEGHLMEFFTTPNPTDNSSRDFYAWQCLALLAMNVDGDRKRSMILELRDKILMVVEGGEERAVKNLNVFLNALGLDASQLS